MASTINATTSSGIVTTADNTGSLQLQTNNGTTAVTIDTSQNVGIGTTSPSNKLHVYGAGAGLTVQRTGGADAGVTSTTTLGNFAFGTGIGVAANCWNVYDLTASAERMRIDASGNTMVGTSSPSALFTVAGSYAQAGTVGLTNYTIDTTPTATAVANGASVDFTLLSGMLVVNSWNTGGVTIWLMGGGGTSAVSSIIGTVGTMSYVYPYYRWTNNSGSTATFGFFCVRTRTGP